MLRRRAILLAFAGCLCLAEIWISGLCYRGYEISYGRHGWGPYEVIFLVYYLLFGGAALALFAGAVAALGGDRLLAGFDRLAHVPSRQAGLLALSASAVAFGLIVLVRFGLLQDMAVTDDENVYAFMAKLFASGRTYAPSLPEPVRPFFDNQFIVNNGKWYGIYFPGHPALLAIGERLGAAHWVPTFAATLTVPLGFAIARRLFGQRTALLTLLLLLLSPYFIFPSATTLAHSSAALLLLAFVYAALRIHGDPRALRWWVVAGVALGWAGLTRPLSPPLFAAPWLVWLVLRVRRDMSRRALGGAAVFCLLGAAAATTLGLYDFVLSGSPFTTGYQTYIRLYNYAVLMQYGPFDLPYPLAVIHELGYTLARLNFWLFGWPLSLVLIPFFRRCEGGLLALSVAGVLAGYAVLRAASINVVGPVHYAELAVPLVILSASGLERLVELCRSPQAPAGAARLALAVPTAGVICLAIVFLPVYGLSLRAMTNLARLPYDLVEALGPKRSLIFVRNFPALAARPGAWVYFPRNNSPDLSDPVLFVKFLGEERNRDLMRYLPDRLPYAMGMQGDRLLLLPLDR